MKHIKKAVCLLLAVLLCAFLPSCRNGRFVFSPPAFVPVIVIPDFGATTLIAEDGTTWPMLAVGGGKTAEEVYEQFSAFALNAVGDPASPFTVVDGSPVADAYGVFDSAAGAYEPLVRALSNEFGGGDLIWFFGYDWRLDCRRTAEELKKYISDVLKSTGAGRVNIVAHGMGGLIAAEYLNYHKSDGYVDTVVTVGTPFLGVPSIPKTLVENQLAMTAAAFDSVDRAASAAVGAKIKETYMTFPSTFELAYFSRYGDLGMIFSNGDLRDNATQAQANAYAFHFAIRENLASIFSGVSHINIIGVGADVEDEDYSLTDGDGYVTARSANGGGAFSQNGKQYVRFELNGLHNELVRMDEAIALILEYAVERHGR